MKDGRSTATDQPETKSAASEDELPKAVQAYEGFLKENSLPDTYETSILYQIFMDLSLIRKWSGLRVARNNSRTYVAGCAPVEFDSVFPGHDKDESVDRTQVILPISASASVSPSQLENICKECVHPETGKQLRCVTIGIVDGDSTTAYYRIFAKWEELIDPQWKRMKKRKEEEGPGTEERTGQENEASSEDSDVNSDSD